MQPKHHSPHPPTDCPSLCDGVLRLTCQAKAFSADCFVHYQSTINAPPLLIIYALCFVSDAISNLVRRGSRYRHAAFRSPYTLVEYNTFSPSPNVLSRPLPANNIHNHQVRPLVSPTTALAAHIERNSDVLYSIR
jgi:hypothetical protein